MLWAFEVWPSALPEIYWTHTLEEIRLTVRMRLSWCQAQSLQQYQVMAILLKQAFGGEEKETVEPPSDLQSAQAQLQALFNPR